MDSPTIRSMAKDLEASKKGVPPPNIPAVIEPISKLPPISPRPTLPPPLPPLPDRQAGQPLTPPPVRPSLPPPPPPPVIPKPPIPTFRPPTPPPPISIKAPPPPTPPISRPSIPPLKPPTELAKRPAPSVRPKRLILLGVIAAAIFLFIIGEIWWFFIRPEPEPTAPAETLLPPPEETITPREEPAQLEITPPLLSYGRTEELTVTGTDTAAVVSGLTELINQPFPANTLLRIMPIVTDPPGEMIIDFPTLASALQLSLPPGIEREITGEYDLFLLTKNSADEAACQKAGIVAADCAGPRLGLALAVKDPVQLASALGSWEATMASDLKTLIVAKVSVGTGTFLNANYKDVAVRYRNFPIDTMTIDYALSGDTLLITTSKNSMFRAIDALP